MASITENHTGARSGLLKRTLGAVSPAVWTLIAVVIIWQIFVDLRHVPEYILPSPTAILHEIIVYGHRLAPNALVTVGEIVVGFIFSILIGIPLAVATVYSPFMQRAIYPLIVMSQTIPKVAIAPLLLTWFGYGVTPKIVIVVLLTFFPIVINTVMGLRATTPEMLYLARSMGASGWQIFWKFRLPKALPSIFAGFKLASVLSVIGAIVAEFVGADSGLGYLILVAGGNFDITRQFASIIVISAIGMVFFAVIARAERKAMPWRPAHESDQEG